MKCCDEYCANYGCNQGRDCPARVAKVGKKYHGSEALRGSVWRYQLRRLAYWLLLAFFGMITWSFIGYVIIQFGSP